MKPSPAVLHSNRKEIFGFISYDWANSAFTTLVLTFIYSAYFTQGIAENEVSGTVWWSRSVAFSAILIALLSPVFGAYADRSGKRKRLFVLFSIMCVVLTALLYFPSEGDVWMALIIVTLANVTYELAIVFYNAFLPSITTPVRMGRISGYAFAAGYAAGLVTLGIALVFFIMPETAPFGLEKEAAEHVRATNLMVAAWMGLFMIPSFIYLRESAPLKIPAVKSRLRDTFRELKQTLTSIRKYSDVAWLLLARLFYNDGLITIYYFGGIYAAGVLGFTTEELLIFGIVLNVLAGLGSWLFGIFDDKYGSKLMIFISLGLLVLGVIFAFFAQTKMMMWIAGVFVGIAIGPNQASSRSLMSRLIPEEKSTEFFGFYAFSGKATSFAGPFLLGISTSLFDSQRAGIAAVLPFLILGGIFLLKVNEKPVRS